MNSGSDYERKPDSVGPPVPVVDVKVVDADGSEVPLGQGRRSCGSRAPMSCAVTGRTPKRRRRRSPTDGCTPATWPRSTTRGFVHIVDRAKDMVIRGGRERLLGRGRGRALRAPRRHRRGRHRHPARPCWARRWVRSCKSGPVPMSGSTTCATTWRPGWRPSRCRCGSGCAKKSCHANPAGKVLKRELRDELVDRAPAGS